MHNPNPPTDLAALMATFSGILLDQLRAQAISWEDATGLVVPLDVIEQALAAQAATEARERIVAEAVKPWRELLDRLLAKRDAIAWARSEFENGRRMGLEDAAREARALLERNKADSEVSP